MRHGRGQGGENRLRERRPSYYFLFWGALREAFVSRRRNNNVSANLVDVVLDANAPRIGSDRQNVGTDDR